MSEAKNSHEASRWIRTAADDLAAAQALALAQRHSHACFLCQQAAEKALKALHFKLDSDPWGHSITKLIETLPTHKDNFSELLDSALALDRFYIPTRYPNGLPDLIPSEAYSHKDAADAVAWATALLEQARSHL